MDRQAVLTSDTVQAVDRYHAGTSFFLASPSGTLLTEGEFTRISLPDGVLSPKELSLRVSEALEQAKRAGLENPVAVGAIPFDPALPARLLIPQSAEWSEPLRFRPSGETERVLEGECRLEEHPSPEAYRTGVTRGLEMIGKGELSKIVLARTLELTSSKPIPHGRLLRNLAVHNPLGYTFAVNLTGPSSGGRGRILCGASPELLVARKGKRVASNPLAGSAARSPDPVEDQRRAAALFESEKDLHEHAVVVEAVMEALGPYCTHMIVPKHPSVIRTRTMWHLSSEISAVLLDDATSSLELAAALHPTPAVCGRPTEAAREAIREIEPFDRGFYTGMVGWCDSEGNGEWVVTIRCAEAEENKIRLYAGAGIVSGSSAEEELRETSAKLRTMLNAMGLQQEVEGGRR
ncbi:isochorismate synthase DhbC [Gorillibacterium sp. sgz5001074]|uniref:isochorismate synthase DhbC n=1 Tax=Gorillibacterium sp. sgz5001074 TaxID=3446695 RepID=UPI003F673D05